MAASKNKSKENTWMYYGPYGYRPGEADSDREDQRDPRSGQQDRAEAGPGAFCN